MMTYVGLDRRFDMEQLGYLPGFLSEDDPRPAAEQYDANYISGWRPLRGWTLNFDTMVLKYPGDPSLKPFAMTHLHGEAIYFYPHAQVLILKDDGTFEVCRMD